MDGFSNVYRGETVLVTGHTGFKGSWLCIWLRELGAKVVGYGLDPVTLQDNFVLSKLSEKIIDIRGDIRDLNKLTQVFEEYKPKYVFHLAAQPIVRESYKSPVYTYEVNVMGTINVLEAIKNCNESKVGIFITTDKCYDNKEQIWGYKENDTLGGYDPYSSSKAACEIAIDSWRRSFMNVEDYSQHGKAIASVRAGNVIGGGDWGQDRIIPDCIRAVENNRPIGMRSPKAIRPWQHVLEPLSGYLLLGEKMTFMPQNFSEAWNFGPNLESIVPVQEVVQKVINYYGRGSAQDISNEADVHEAKLLNLDISKARFVLGWAPSMKLDEAIKLTVNWYKQYKEKDVYEVCIKQIEEFMKIQRTLQ